MNILEEVRLSPAGRALALLADVVVAKQQHFRILCLFCSYSTTKHNVWSYETPRPSFKAYGSIVPRGCVY